MGDATEPLHEVAETLYRVTVDEGPDAGTVARFREPGIGEYATLVELRLDGDAEPLFEFVATFLVSWNLTRGGEPIPVGLDSVRGLSPGLFIKLLESWIEAIGGTTDAPLGSPSPNGGPPAEASIPMEPLLPNHPTLSAPT